MQVTFTESEGEKKLANLPYTFFLKAVDNVRLPPWTKVRVGSRVPVYVGKERRYAVHRRRNQYRRAWLSPDDDGRFDLYLNLERSWVEGDVRRADGETLSTRRRSDIPDISKNPSFVNSKTELDLTMRDGQTIQTTQAADPSERQSAHHHRHHERGEVTCNRFHE